ncbi:endo-1,4-beta-xylanase [Rhizobium tumorigenes]|uniref:endo-1,4-beta-xylanase n=1 Tax=Rhizobium tumorigenes TaxID=2041385 RepID=UPI00241D62F6|nr:endo-1,4-beta-xylanase [Rhizobium tumorigenes]WFS01573.1 endo-1,4-beta-xylanase [Rhizobium tumorigenes]
MIKEARNNEVTFGKPAFRVHPVGLSFGQGGGIPPAVPFVPTSGFLAALGYTQADVDALPSGIKGCAAWLITGRAIDNDRLNNPSNGINADAVARDFNAWIGENIDKWPNNEPSKDTYDWSLEDTAAAQMTSLAPSVATRILHLALGQNSYVPAWAQTELASTPGNILALVDRRVAELKAKFASNSAFYRIDAVNEITNSATAGSVASDRGWRTSASAFYTASQDATTKATILGGNSEYWWWYVFQKLRAAYPSAKLSFTDFNLEDVLPPEDYTPSALSAPYAGQNAFATDNSSGSQKQRIDRARYEIWRAKAASVPVDVIGYQLHVVPTVPPYFDAMIATLWDWNRFGVVPAVTEFNALNIPGASSLPVHIKSQDQNTINRYVAWVAHAYLKVLLANSPIEEVSFWSIGGGGETSTVLGTDHPIRTATMLAISKAAAPNARTLKRGSRTEGRYSVPLHVAATGTQSYSSNRVSLTAAGSLQIPWAWFNDAWMARPISASDYILSCQFYSTASLTNGTVIQYIGNPASGNYAQIIVNATTVRLEIYVANALVLGQNLGTMALNAHQRVSVRIAGTAVKASLNGGAVQSFTATGSFSDQTKVSWLSRPDNTGWSASLSSVFIDVHHGPDWNTDADLVTLSTPLTRSISLGVYDGA